MMEYAFDVRDLEENLVPGDTGRRGICNLDNDMHRIWGRKDFRVGSIEE